MSTKLTKEKPTMVESQALQLVLGASQVNDSIALYLSNYLKNKGYAFATPAALNFLSTLECGINYGSEIARNLGVSRQMVAKTVKGLCLAGYLEQVDGTGKQKEILFTETGELLMSEARQLLAEVDSRLSKQLSEESINTTIESLNQIQALMMELIES
ncbi:MarR family transcriptional regulator [Marinomonas sp. 5E14-1]|uniref:MarR family winged helix-turn-helix transcriptional regulator n=1 Tax=Marinomonas sp. 5E14-1 TaxID=3153922 RepID=UPI00326735DF